jgi:hypothetical protein
MVDFEYPVALIDGVPSPPNIKSGIAHPRRFTASKLLELGYSYALSAAGYMRNTKYQNQEWNIMNPMSALRRIPVPSLSQN